MPKVSANLPSAVFSKSANLLNASQKSATVHCLMPNLLIHKPAPPFIKLTVVKDCFKYSLPYIRDL